MVIGNVSTSIVIGNSSTFKYHGSMVIGNTLWQHSLTALNPRRKHWLNGNLWMCRVFLCCSWLIYYSSTSEAAALLSLPGFHMVRWDDIWRSQCCLKLGRLCSPVFYNPVTSVPFCLAVWAITNLSGQHIFAFCWAGCSVFFLDTTNQKVYLSACAGSDGRWSWLLNQSLPVCAAQRLLYERLLFSVLRSLGVSVS